MISYFIGIALLVPSAYEFSFLLECNRPVAYRLHFDDYGFAIQSNGTLIRICSID